MVKNFRFLNEAVRPVEVSADDPSNDQIKSGDKISKNAAIKQYEELTGNNWSSMNMNLKRGAAPYIIKGMRTGQVQPPSNISSERLSKAKEKNITTQQPTTTQPPTSTQQAQPAPSPAPSPSPSPSPAQQSSQSNKQLTIQQIDDEIKKLEALFSTKDEQEETPLKENKNIAHFLKFLSEKNYAKANNYLNNIIQNKIKNTLLKEMK